MKLSIVTVCYNAEKTINETLKSVANSLISYDLTKDVEYIIIDGNSTDGTLKIVKDFCRSNTFSSYLSENDDGIYDAYNKGIKLSSSKFVWFVNADDVLKHNAAKIVIDSINKHSYADIYCFSLNRVNSDTKKMYSQLRDCKSPVKRLSPVCHTPSIIWSIKCLKEIGGFNTSLRICSDFYALQHLLKNNYIFIGFADVVIDMYLGGVSSQYKFEFLKAKEQIFVINEVSDSLLLKVPAVLKIIFKLLRNVTINPAWRFFKKKYA